MSAANICLRQPIPEIAIAANFLRDAVEAYHTGDIQAADALIRKADMPEIGDWTESLWGKASPYVIFRAVENAPTFLAKYQRLKMRMPSSAEKAVLLKRDGHHCRFCSIPVVRSEIRSKIAKVLPEALRWGNANILQHRAFQAMWVQYDHLIPHARGGDNSPENMVVTCAPCNFARMQYTLEEVGLDNPLNRQPYQSTWDGLESF